MLKWLGLVLLISAGVFGASLVGLMIGYSWQSTTEKSDQQSTAEYKQKQENREQQEPFWQRATSDPIAAFTLWLVIFTAVLGITSVLQYGSLIRGEATSAKAANAAKDSADIAREALITGNRAFVMPSDFKTVWHENTDGSIWWELRPGWSNAGNTRTDGLRVYVNSYFENTALPNDWSFPPFNGPKTPFYLGPKQSTGGSPIIKTGVELAEVKSRAKWLYIWGTAHYRDVFTGTPDHVTRFAWEITVFGDPTKPVSDQNVVTFSTKLLDRHNCTDEECSKQGFP
jgi:hypothetical protein